MTAARHEDPNVQILRALGITQKNVLAADLCLRPGQLPRFTVDCLADPDTMLHEVLSFDLVPRNADPKPRAPLDLDAMCAAACTRLTAEVHHSASMALAAHQKESAAIRARMGTAMARYRDARANALLRIDISPMVAQIGRSLFGNGVASFLGAGCIGGAFGGLK